jgi:hypothetical protein
MNRPVMNPAKRSNELVANLPTKRTRLREAEVVGVRGLSPAHETRLLGHEPEMLLVAIATRFGNRKDALVDPFGSEFNGRL